MKLRILSVLICASSFGQANSLLPPDYQTRSANDKQSYLWESCEMTPWGETLPEWNGSGWSSILGMASSFFTLAKTFSHESDEIPEGREKIIHKYGVLAKFRWEPVPSQMLLTGIYQSGAVGVVRLSLAADPTKNSYTPGMALKLLVDGQPSVNLFAMNHLEGQGDDDNFFAKVFSNKIDPPQSVAFKTVAWIFSFVKNPPTDLSVLQPAQRDRNGIEFKTTYAPDQLFFEPTSEVVQQYKSTSGDMRVRMTQIPAGSTIYKVYANQSELNGGIHIANMVLESSPRSCVFADKHLFFQHPR